MRKYIYALSVALIFCVGLTEANSRPMTQVSPNIKMGFGPSTPAEVGLDDEFIKFVDGAKESIEGAFFEIRLDSFVDAFIRAKKRGVKVKLVVDSNNYYLPPDPATQDDVDALTPHPVNDPTKLDKLEMNPFVARIKKAGISVVEDNMRSALMHNKFAIRDKNTVWTGSYNLTDTCSYRNPNNAIQVTSVPLAKIYRAEFLEMYSKHQFGITSPKHKKKQVVSVDGVNMEVYFAPEDNPNKRIAQAIADAKEEVFFMQFAFTADDLRDLLIKKHKSGVKVRGIFDRMLYRSTGPYGEFSHLTEVGIPVKIFPGRGKFHHKVFVVDPDGENPIVVLGSENASTNGNKANDENVLVIHSKAIAQMFKKEFDSIFGKFSDAAAFMQIADLPFALEPISMGELHIFANGKGIDKIRVEYPARWKMEGLNRGTVTILRNDKDTTSKEKLRFSNNGYTLESANLKGSGANSHVSMRFVNVPAPEIAGKYALLMSVAYKDSPNKFVPLRNNPTIWVFDPEKVEDFSRLLDYVERLHISLEEMKNSLTSTQKKNQANILRMVINKIQNLLCRGVKNGELVRTEMSLDRVEALPKRWYPYVLAITKNLKPLREALRHRVLHENDQEAARILKRVEKFVENAARK